MSQRLDPDRAAQGDASQRLDPDRAAGGDASQRLDPDRAAGGEASHRLDPDRAARESRSARPRTPLRPRTSPLAIDPRPYRWAIGAFGIAVVIVVSVVLFLTRGVATVGIAPGHRLHNFAAPLASSNLVGNANFAKPCRLGYLGPRTVNTCLLSRRAPLVLAFFVTDSSACVREIDTLEKVSRRLAHTSVRFAAVAVRASRSQTAKLVGAHHWTIPVAYDLDGAVGAAYSVEICPLLELAYRGGVVKYRLIGDRWLNPSALALKVRALAG